MKKRFSDYEDYLEIFNYCDEKDLKNVLRNIPRLQELAESTKGVANATVIIADISKALTCIVDDFDCIPDIQFKALYYVFLCGFTYAMAGEEMRCNRYKVRREADKVIKKLIYVLGDDHNGKEPKRERIVSNGRQIINGRSQVTTKAKV